MDNNVLFKISYGIFLLGTKSGDKVNGCITNTAMQISNSPDRIAITSLNTNYTTELLKESGQFALTLFDKTCSFDTISLFGFNSGRDMDKFAVMPPVFDNYGQPYLKDEACGVISAKVVDTIDFGSHTMFIAEIQDLKSLSDESPLTYEYYQDHVKPKEEKKTKKIVAWKCTICGYIYEGADIPDDYICPECGYSRKFFEPVYEE